MNESAFGGALTQYDQLYLWANEKCTPTVREITFENAEVTYSTASISPFKLNFYSRLLI